MSTEHSDVRLIADAYVGVLAAHEPAAAQAIGRNADAMLADLTPEWCAERAALDLSTLAALDALDPATFDTADAALHAALSERLASNNALFNTGFTPRLLAPLATPVHELRELFDGVVVTNSERGDAIIERLSGVPQALLDYRRRLLWSRAEGEAGHFSGTGTAAARQVQTVADQMNAWIDPAGMDFYRSIPAAADLAEASRVRLAEAAEAATRASQDFIAFLTEELLPLAPTSDAVGAEVYRATARSFLGTELDLDEIYDYGWAELHRLVAQSERLAVDILGDGAVPEQSGPQRAAALLNSDPAYRLSGTGEITDWLETRLEATIVALDRVAFDLPANIRDVDYLVTEAASGVVYYTPAAPDGSVQSKIVWTVPRGQGSVSTWHEMTGLHHEGVPGHHLEHSINRANDTLHPWQRYLCEVHGYAEGWAHYSEELADELGLIHNQAERFGMTLGQIWRAVRVVADIGLHTGRAIPSTLLTTETVWTTAVARSFLENFALTDAHTARFEVDRYLGWPGQALAFKVGAKLWKDARSDASIRPGFTLAGFHKDALAAGPMGLGPLREILLGNASPQPVNGQK